ncbi:hypothetical protein L596_005489 [Steinernema carpocapsae]|uniref:CULT domain-containing protein n=1 Tax=Steinernema carpocapsae TaxID=34508 RepID=A0A4U8V2U0_STECR|nr:hypothetical protein L596_005489 [Steinernema carpocapsae]
MYPGSGEAAGTNFNPREQSLHGYRFVEGEENTIENTASSSAVINSIVTVPGIVVPLVVFPGQSMPFLATCPQGDMIPHFVKHARSDFPFIVAIPGDPSHGIEDVVMPEDPEEEVEDTPPNALFENKTPKRATLLQIRSFCEKADIPDVIHFEAIAKHRVRIIELNMETKIYAGRIHMAFFKKVIVEILPEPDFDNRLGDFRGYYCHIVPVNFLKRRNAENDSMLQAITPISPELMRRTQLGETFREMEKLMKQRFENKYVSFQDYSTTEKSFWLARNIPFDTSARLKLLNEDQPIIRLVEIMKLATRIQAICCANCMNRLSDEKEWNCFMSTEGASAIFVNPGGILHDVIFAFGAAHDGIHFVGRPSFEYSWFDGYGWSCARCAHCFEYVGWKFTSERYRPECFFAFTRRAVMPEYETVVEPEL